MIRQLVLCAALLAAVPAAAQPAGSEYKADDDATVLHLSESAQRVLRQDRLTVEMRVDVNAGDPGRVQATINRRMAAALEAAKAVPDVHVETRGYWVQEERPANAPVRWHGVQGLALTGADPATLLKLAGDLQRTGLVMSGLNYDVAPETARAVEDEITAEALKRLRDRAGRIATEMNLELRNVRDLRVGNVSGRQPPRPFLMRSAAMPAAAPPPSAEPGDTTLQVTVDADIVLTRKAP
jgi:uncharacterized protein